LLEALDKLASAVVAVMVLFAMINVTIFLILGRLAPWTDLADDHRLLVTSMPWRSVLVNSNTESFHEHYMDITTEETSPKCFFGVWGRLLS
jgi:hypothetical protein